MDNKISRATVKGQAKQLIKGNVITLFIISIIVSFLTSFSISVNIPVSSIRDAFNGIKSSAGQNNSKGDFDFGHFEDYGDEDFEKFFEEFGDGSNPIDQFGSSSSNNNGSSDLSGLVSIFDSLSKSSSNVFVNFFRLASFLLSPLAVTLTGFYIAYVRRNEHGDLNFGSEIKHIFKVSFNETYGKKLGVYFFRKLLQTLLTMLFIVPGIIFYYSSYFAYQIMCECPHLSPMEAIRLSKKMIKGNRGELFVLDLSFLPWLFLVCITAGIAGIYVLPYIQTTDTLYYENFKIRALMEGRVSEDDFKSPEQKANEYAQNQYQYTSDANTQNSGDYFYSPAQPQNENYFTGSYAPEQNSYSGSYQPEQNTYSGSYAPPQPTPQETYTPPQPSDYYTPSEQSDDSSKE